ncbi:hypothetical protein [Chroococcidiopsis sp.]|uniref:hypothetical protein n=1 Tax=Chroococcidiopsis sp. TaxID=3088168 RepID=UPI003F388808
MISSRSLKLIGLMLREEYRSLIASQCNSGFCHSWIFPFLKPTVVWQGAFSPGIGNFYPHTTPDTFSRGVLENRKTNIQLNTFRALAP